MEVFFAFLILAIICVLQAYVSLRALNEVKAFRELNEGLGAMIMEIEAAQNQMKAGIIAAIHERAMADQPEDKARAH